jgi:hypothetical protein
LDDLRTYFPISGKPEIGGCTAEFAIYGPSPFEAVAQCRNTCLASADRDGTSG